jgi:hypothetical protein
MARPVGRPRVENPAPRPRDGNSGRAAVALRLAGASFHEIADTLGLADYIAARNMVEKDLAARLDDPEARTKLRNEEAARIERILRGVWNKAVSPEDPEHLPAARVALALIDRHARLLGLDMPTEVIVHSPTTSEIDLWVSQVIAGHAETVIDVEEADVLAIQA